MCNYGPNYSMAEHTDFRLQQTCSNTASKSSFLREPNVEHNNEDFLLVKRHIQL